MNWLLLTLLILANLPTIVTSIRRPTRKPTRKQLVKPTRKPTRKVKPTRKPTRRRTGRPTPVPTNEPTLEPTQEPSSEPTPEETPEPTLEETPEPTPESIIEAGDEFTCPLLGSINFSGDGALRFYNSESGKICTLVQVSPDRLSFKPVGRSYDSREWEASSGEFSSLQWLCENGSCIVDLPTLPQGSIYKLTSFDTSNIAAIGNKNDIARFLEQATFGPAIEQINKLNERPNLSDAIAEWITEQQRDIPISSHREMFRRLMNARMETATYNAAVTNPCQMGTRYRVFSFSSKDHDKYLEIESIGNKKVLRVDGFIRTVVNGPIFNTWKPSSEWPDGR
jgi:hypothetical protein